MELKWTKVEDGLPSSTGWYLTYSPGYYRSRSFTNRESCEGLVFSKFVTTKDGKSYWSIEGTGTHAECYGRKVVIAWMPLPLPEWANP